MSDYQLEIKQLAVYPRCRVYREFIQSLVQDRSIRTNGGSGLFFYAALCAYANFRTSYRRLEGIGFTVFPGEWVYTVRELAELFRVRLRCKIFDILDQLADQSFIQYAVLARGKVVKVVIRGWSRYNTVLDYNCPCQKDVGFFFLPYSVVPELISMGRASEMDAMLDLWLSGVYQDEQVIGSQEGPVVYFRDGSGVPLVSYTELSQRWGVSRATVGRFLKRLEGRGYLEVLPFPGRSGSLIYLKQYLPVMFQIPDREINKQGVAKVFHTTISFPEMIEDVCDACVSPTEICVSNLHEEEIVAKVQEVLSTQGFPCTKCKEATYMLFQLSTECTGRSRESMMRFGLSFKCGSRGSPCQFELTITPNITYFQEEE